MTAAIVASVLMIALPAAAQVPSAPIGVSPQVNGSTVTLSWSAPNSGGPVAGYAVDAGTSSGATNLANNYVVGNVLAVTSPPLPPGTYFARVKAYNQFNTAGPVSTEVQFTIAGPTPPGPPTGVSASVNGTLVTASWGPPATGGTPTDYLIDAGTSPGGSNLANGLSVGAGLAVAANLPPGVYYIRVRARNAQGTSAPSTEVVATVGAQGLPGAPTNFDYTVVGGTVTLHWDAPASGGSPTGYVIEVGTNPGLSNLVVQPVGNVTSVTFGGVPDGNYFVRVRATNATGPGPVSNERVITAYGTACTGQFGATLTWDTGSVSGSPYHVDMDLHVKEPGNVHVFYGSPLGTTLQLDRDNTIAFGPENICNRAPVANGTYEIYVVAYSGNQWPTTARIVVRSNVGTANEQYRVFTRTFTSPTAPNSGLAQNVATVTYPGGVITETLGTRSPFFTLFREGVVPYMPKQ